MKKHLRLYAYIYIYIIGLLLQREKLVFEFYSEVKPPTLSLCLNFESLELVLESPGTPCICLDNLNC